VTARGALVAFEGLDQSGKQTQAALLGERLAAQGRRERQVSFPEYETPHGQELARAVAGERD
jgi:dTMP kinase